MSINLSACRPGPTNSLADVTGIFVGHTSLASSGVTAIVAPQGAVGGVDVRGGGPGTRETDLLEPYNTVQQVHAVMLSGGSAFGLATADGAMRELRSRDLGLQVMGPEHPGVLVPLVPAAVIFDLLVGSASDLPTAADGAAAVAAALDGAGASGCGEGTIGRRRTCIGAGVGASAGALQGGFGQASCVLGAGPGAGTTIAVGLAVNPLGSAINPDTGLPWGLAAGMDDEFGPFPELTEAQVERLRNLNHLGTKLPKEVFASGGGGEASASPSSLNTTIGVIATDAALTKAQAKRLAMVGHDGLARGIRPVHSPMDGDTLFCLSTNEESPRHCDDFVMTALCAAVAATVERAVVDAVLGAESGNGVPSWREIVGAEL